MNIQELEAQIKSLQEQVSRHNWSIDAMSQTLDDKVSRVELNDIKDIQKDYSILMSKMIENVADINRRLSVYNKINSLLDVNIEKPSINDYLIYDGDRWTNSKFITE